MNPAIAPLVSVLAEDGSLAASSLQNRPPAPTTPRSPSSTLPESATVMYTIVVAKAGVTLDT